MNAEFDNYIENYRAEQDKAVALSGESSEFFAAYKTEKLMKWFAHYINEPVTILDFGCGDGLMTNFVRQAFWKARVVGTDPSGKSIEQAQKEFVNIEFYQTPNVTLPFADATFDLIYAAGVFHHIPFEQHAAYLADVMRVLKPGGSFVLFELNPLNPLTMFTFLRTPIEKDAHILTPWYAYKILKKYGTKRLLFYCFFPKWFARLRPLEPYMTKIPFGALYAVVVKKQYDVCPN